MLILSSTTDRLQIITDAACTLDVHASWMDNLTGTVTPGRTNTAITTAATTNVVGGPAASAQRNVKTLHAANRGAAAVGVTVAHTDGTTTVQLHKLALAANTTLQYIDEIGFVVLAAATFAPGSNLIGNSGLEVSQEFGTAVTPSITGVNRYVADMFGVHVLGPTVITAQQIADAPAGFYRCIKISVTTPDAAPAITSKALIYTAVEGYRCARLLFGSANAQSVALAFWVKANRTGSYSASIENFSVNRCYPFNFSVNSSATWEYKTQVIPGDIAGTWDAASNAGLYVNWVMMAGTNFTGTANTWNAARTEAVTGTLNGVAATTDYMQITGVSLIPGTTPLAQGSISMRPFDEELALCQRYYEKSFNYPVAPTGAATAGSSSIVVGVGAAVVYSAGTAVPFLTGKRVAPTMTVRSPFDGSVGNAYDNVAAANVAATLSQIGETSFFWQTANAGAQATGSFSANWIADARL